MSKKKRDFGEPVFHCFVSSSLEVTISRIHNLEQDNKVNYVYLNGSDEFHYFMLQYLSPSLMVQGRLLGTLNPWAQTDETSVGIFAFDLHLYDRMVSASVYSDTPSIYDIEAYYRMSRKSASKLPDTITLGEKQLIEIVQKALEEKLKD